MKLRSRASRFRSPVSVRSLDGFIGIFATRTTRSTLSKQWLPTSCFCAARGRRRGGQADTPCQFCITDVRPQARQFVIPVQEDEISSPLVKAFSQPFESGVLVTDSDVNERDVIRRNVSALREPR